MADILFWDGYVKGDTVLFSSSEYNAFMEMNINTGSTKVIARFSGESDIRTRLHRKVIYYKNRLLFIPRIGNKIHIWDMETENWAKPVILNTKNKVTVADAFLYQDIIWIVANEPKILLIQIFLEKNMAKTNAILSEKLQNIVPVGNSKIAVGWMSATFVKGKLYIAAHNQPRLCSVNLNCGEEIEEFYFDKECLIHGISQCSEENLWLVEEYTGKVHEWNSQKGIIRTMQINAADGQLKVPYTRVVDIDSKTAYLLPYQTNSIYKINKSTFQTESVISGFENNRCRLKDLFGEYVIMDNMLILFPVSIAGLVKLNLVTDEINIVIPFVSQKDEAYINSCKREQIREAMTKGKLSESIGWSEVLPIFIEEIGNADHFVNGATENIGNKIFSYCMNILDK